MGARAWHVLCWVGVIYDFCVSQCVCGGTLVCSKLHLVVMTPPCNIASPNDTTSSTQHCKQALVKHAISILMSCSVLYSGECFKLCAHTPLPSGAHPAGLGHRPQHPRPYVGWVAPLCVEGLGGVLLTLSFWFEVPDCFDVPMGWGSSLCGGACVLVEFRVVGLGAPSGPRTVYITRLVTRWALFSAGCVVRASGI